MQAGRREGVGAAAAQAARIEDPTVEAGGGASAVRTSNMYRMVLTLDVSRLSGWLNADACCRVEREAWEKGRHGGREAGGRGAAAARAACRGGPTVEAAGRGTRGAHVKHLLHGCDAGGVPARYVCVELGQAVEEPGHVCDCRDAPARDGAVRRSGGSRVGVIGDDRRLQGGRGREYGRAVPRSPARAIASRRKGRGARPCATDEELVGG